MDRRAIEEFGVPGVVLMENAALGVVAVALDMLRLAAPGRPVVILCGGGNNGGDGLAVARHLHNRGHDVRVGLCVDPSSYKGDALVNWRIVEATGIAARAVDPARQDLGLPLAEAALVIDAIFGTGLTAPPRPPFAAIVGAIDAAARPVLAIDLPSGLDADAGVPLGDAAVKADRTVTFVAEKAGFAHDESRRYTGHVTVADIGCPRGIVEAVVSEAVAAEAVVAKPPARPA